MSAARALLPGAVPVIVLAGSLLAVPVLLAPEQASAAGSTMSSSSAGSARATHSRTLPVPSKREARLASRNQRPLADTEAAAEEATDGPDKDIALKAVSSAGGPAHPVRVFIMGRNGTAVAYEVRREQWLLTGPPVDWVPLYEGNDPHALQRALDTRLHRISKIKTGDGVIPPGWSRLFPKSPNTASQGPTSPVSPLRPLRGGFSELKQLVQDKRGTFVVVGPGEGASDSDVFFLYRYPNKDLVGVYTPDGRREWFRDTDEGWGDAGRAFSGLTAGDRGVIVGDTAIRAAFRQPRAVSRMTAVNLAGNVARPEEAVYLYPGAASTQPAFKLVVHDGHMTLLRNDSGTWTKVANALHRKGQTWGLLDQELNGLHDPHAQLERDPTAPPRRHR